MTALTEAPDEFQVPEAEEERAAFRVLNDRMATWAMRKMAEKVARTREVEATAAAEIERVQAWLDRERQKSERESEWFESLLADYAYRERERDPRRKSIPTPYGTVRTREKQPALVIEDAGQLLAWAKETHPELVRVVEDVPLAAIREALPVVNGEVPPGMSIRPGGITATVDIDLGGN